MGLEAFAGLAVGVAGVVGDLVDHHHEQRQFRAELGDLVCPCRPEQVFAAVHLLADLGEEFACLVGVGGVADAVGGDPPRCGGGQVRVDHHQPHISHEGSVREKRVDGHRLARPGHPRDQPVCTGGEVEADRVSVLVLAEQDIVPAGQRAGLHRRCPVVTDEG
ncbi:hypothetical protein GCM10020256_74450 [Streptomyces thermocoprophilus]